MLTLLFISLILGCFSNNGAAFGDVSDDLCGLPNGVFPNPSDCASYISCLNGVSEVKQCPDDLLFNPFLWTCDYNNNGNCSSVDDFDTPTIEETEDIVCEADGPNLHPIPSNCSRYYICNSGIAYQASCPVGLLMNSDKLTCDYASDTSCDITSTEASSTTTRMVAIIESDSFGPNIPTENEDETDDFTAEGLWDTPQSTETLDETQTSLPDIDADFSISTEGSNAPSAEDTTVRETTRFVEEQTTTSVSVTEYTVNKQPTVVTVSTEQTKEGTEELFTESANIPTSLKPETVTTQSTFPTQITTEEAISLIDNSTALNWTDTPLIVTDDILKITSKDPYTLDEDETTNEEMKTVEITSTVTNSDDPPVPETNSVSSDISEITATHGTTLEEQSYITTSQPLTTSTEKNNLSTSTIYVSKSTAKQSDKSTFVSNTSDQETEEVSSLKTESELFVSSTNDIVDFTNGDKTSSNTIEDTTITSEASTINTSRSDIQTSSFQPPVSESYESTTFVSSTSDKEEEVSILETEEQTFVSSTNDVVNSTNGDSSNNIEDTSTMTTSEILTIKWSTSDIQMSSLEPSVSESDQPTSVSNTSDQEVEELGSLETEDQTFVSSTIDINFTNGDKDSSNSPAETTMTPSEVSTINMSRSDGQMSSLEPTVSTNKIDISTIKSIISSQTTYKLTTSGSTVTSEAKASKNTPTITFDVTEEVTKSEPQPEISDPDIFSKGTEFTEPQEKTVYTSQTLMSSDPSPDDETDKIKTSSVYISTPNTSPIPENTDDSLERESSSINSKETLATEESFQSTKISTEISSTENTQSFNDTESTQTFTLTSEKELTVTNEIDSVSFETQDEQNFTLYTSKDLESSKTEEFPKITTLSEDVTSTKDQKTITASEILEEFTLQRNSTTESYTLTSNIENTPDFSDNPLTSTENDESASTISSDTIDYISLTSTPYSVTAERLIGTTDTQGSAFTTVISTSRNKENTGTEEFSEISTLSKNVAFTEDQKRITASEILEESTLQRDSTTESYTLTSNIENTPNFSDNPLTSTENDESASTVSSNTIDYLSVTSTLLSVTTERVIETTKTQGSAFTTVLDISKNTENNTGTIEFVSIAEESTTQDSTLSEYSTTANRLSTDIPSTPEHETESVLIANETTFIENSTFPETSEYKNTTDISIDTSSDFLTKITETIPDEITRNETSVFETSSFGQSLFPTDTTVIFVSTINTTIKESDLESTAFDHTQQSSSEHPIEINTTEEDFKSESTSEFKSTEQTLVITSLSTETTTSGELPTADFSTADNTDELDETGGSTNEPTRITSTFTTLIEHETTSSINSTDLIFNNTNTDGITVSTNVTQDISDSSKISKYEDETTLLSTEPTPNISTTNFENASEITTQNVSSDSKIEEESTTSDSINDNFTTVLITGSEPTADIQQPDMTITENDNVSLILTESSLIPYISTTSLINTDSEISTQSDITSQNSLETDTIAETTLTMENIFTSTYLTSVKPSKYTDVSTDNSNYTETSSQNSTSIETTLGQNVTEVNQSSSVSEVLTESLVSVIPYGDTDETSKDNVTSTYVTTVSSELVVTNTLTTNAEIGTFHGSTAYGSTTYDTASKTPKTKATISVTYDNENNTEANTKGSTGDISIATTEISTSKFTNADKDFPSTEYETSKYDDITDNSGNLENDSKSTKDFEPTIQAITTDEVTTPYVNPSLSTTIPESKNTSGETPVVTSSDYTESISSTYLTTISNVSITTDNLFTVTKEGNTTETQTYDSSTNEILASSPTSETEPSTWTDNAKHETDVATVFSTTEKTDVISNQTTESSTFSTNLNIDVSSTKNANSTVTQTLEAKSMDASTTEATVIISEQPNEDPTASEQPSISTLPINTKLSTETSSEYTTSTESTVTVLSICTKSSGFYPNPGNCSTFYQCSKGVAKLSSCTENFHFSPISKMCEDPCSAKCDRNAECSTISSEDISTETVKLTSDSTDQQQTSSVLVSDNTRDNQGTDNTLTSTVIGTENTSPYIDVSTISNITDRTSTELDTTIYSSTLTGKDFITGTETIESTSKILTIYTSETTQSDTTTRSFISSDATSQLPFTYITDNVSGSVTDDLTSTKITTEIKSSSDSTTKAYTSEAPLDLSTIAQTSIEDHTVSTTTVSLTSSETTETENEMYSLKTDETTETSTNESSTSRMTIDTSVTEDEISSSTLSTTEFTSFTQSFTEDLNISSLPMSVTTNIGCKNPEDCLSSKVPDGSTHIPFSFCSRSDFLPGSKCNEFINCTHSVPERKKCPTGLNFNPTTRVCDWPYNAGCGEIAKPLYIPDDNFDCPCKSCIIPSSENCQDYHLCLGYTAYLLSCTNGLLFDPSLNTCTYAFQVDCPIPTTISTTSTKLYSTTRKPTTTTTRRPTSTSKPHIFICPSSNGLFRNPDNCGKFYQCSNWRSYKMSCPTSLHFSENTMRCEYPCDAKCDLTLSCGVSSRAPNDPRCPCRNCNVASPETCTKYIECIDGRAINKNCPRGQTYDDKRKICDWAHRVNCRHSEICPKLNGVFSYKENCHKFVHCSNGIPYIKNCPYNLEFDPVKQRCEWPNGRCSESQTAKELDIFQGKDHTDGWECPQMFGYFADEEHCGKFFYCSLGTPHLKECSDGLLYNPRHRNCDWKKHVRCDSNRRSSSRKCRVYNRHVTCSMDRTPLPHARCNMYYDCSAGAACERQCPVGLYFSKTTEVCDLPANVKCHSAEQEHSLKDVSNYCASNGRKKWADPADESCFYRCQHGKVIAGCCSKGRIYNAQKDNCERKPRKIVIRDVAETHADSLQ